MTYGKFTSAELASQPECWERADEVAARSTALPAPGERVLLLGCGTSYYMGLAYAELREAGGHGITDAAVASEWSTRPQTRAYDRAVAISRSGTSVELLHAVDRLPKDLRVTALLGTPDSPLGRHGRCDVVDLSFADEQSVVQTRFATTVLATLRAGLGDNLRADVADARAASAADLPAQPTAQLVVLGHGWAGALAQEAALKCREAAAIWAEAYPDGEYRHGPLAVAGPHTLVWGLTPLSDVLVRAVTATGAQVEQPRFTPQAELVRIHRFAVRWALSRGRDPDFPAHLGRSVVHV